MENSVPIHLIYRCRNCLLRNTLTALPPAIQLIHRVALFRIESAAALNLAGRKMAFTVLHKDVAAPNADIKPTPFSAQRTSLYVAWIWLKWSHDFRPHDVYTPLFVQFNSWNTSWIVFILALLEGKCHRNALTCRLCTQKAKSAFPNAPTFVIYGIVW